MADLTVNPRDKINLTVTNRNKTGSGVTWDEIRGTWDEHSSDTWDSPRLGTTKRAKIDLTVTPRNKN